jgi:hypothetical protein
MLSGRHLFGERDLTRTVRVFDFEMGVSGAAVVGAGHDGDRSRLCPGCLSDGEVDAQIQLLKDDLNAVAIRMKQAIRERGPLRVVSKNAPRP